MITILRRRVAYNIWVATLKVKVTAWPNSKIMSSPQLCYLKSDFKTISHKWSPYGDEVTRATFWSLPERSMTFQQNRVQPITSLFEVRFYNYFTNINHHIETTCRAQHFGCYFEGQGYSMTLQQKRDRPITSLFEVGFYNYFTWNYHYIKMMCSAQPLGRYLEGQGHSMTLKQNRVRPITS